MRFEGINVTFDMLENLEHRGVIADAGRCQQYITRIQHGEAVEIAYQEPAGAKVKVSGWPELVKIEIIP